MIKISKYQLIKTKISKEYYMHHIMTILKKEKIRLVLVHFLELQLLPLCLLLCPFLLIFIRNIEEIAFSNDLFIIVGLSYIALNILLIIVARYNRLLVLRTSFFLSVLFISFNVFKAQEFGIPLWQDALFNSAITICAAILAIKIASDNIRFITFYSSLFFISNIYPIGSDTYEEYKNNIYRAGLTGSTEEFIQDEDNSTNSNAKGNLYHIILDGFQSSTYNDIVQNHNYLLPEDFVYIPKFKSSYSVTSYSFSNFLLGEYYDSSKEIYDWQYNEIRERGLFKSLINNDIKISLHPHYAYLCMKEMAMCQTSRPHDNKNVIEQSKHLVLDLWFQFLVPSILDRLLCPKCDQNQNARSRTNFGFSLSNFLGTGDLTLTPVQYFPYYSREGLKRFYENEKNRSANGNYIFIHLLLPHPPYIYDENCIMNKNNIDRTHINGTYNLYKDQSRCAMKTLDQIVEKIKEANNYDNSMIIVHSDHGFKFLSNNTDGAIVAWDTIPKKMRNAIHNDKALHQKALESLSDVIMFIKPPEGKTIASDTPIQPIDIAPIVLEHFNISTDSYEGLTFTQLQTEQAQTREAQKFHLNTFKMPEQKPIPFEGYELNKDGNWNLIGNIPINWKGEVYSD